MIGVWFYFILYFYRFYLIFFREGGGRGKREGEKHQCVRDTWLPLTHPLLGTWPTTQACALTGNRTSDPLGPTQSTEPHQPGHDLKVFREELIWVGAWKKVRKEPWEQWWEKHFRQKKQPEGLWWERGEQEEEETRSERQPGSRQEGCRRQW